jgi:hypothetical protein
MIIMIEDIPQSECEDKDFFLLSQKINKIFVKKVNWACFWNVN